MDEKLKDLFASGLYQSYEKNLNFFNYFNITPQDLENAFKYMEDRWDDPKKLKKTIEDNINATINLLLKYTRDQNGKYTIPVSEKDREMNRAYICGMFFTAIRILANEFMYVVQRDTKTMSRINVPHLDKELKSYNIHDYRKGLRAFMEGIITWFYKELKDTPEIRDLLIAHDTYFDNNIFQLGHFRNLFVWIWMWSQVRIATEFYDFAVEWSENDAHWPKLRRHCLDPFIFFLNDKEEMLFKDIQRDREAIDMWKEDELVDEYEEMYLQSQYRMEYNKDLKYEDYLKVVDTIGGTFYLFAGFHYSGYAGKLADTLYERYKIIAPGQVLDDIVDSLTFKVGKNSFEDIEKKFYELTLFQKPLLAFSDDENQKIIISYPEIIMLSRKLNEFFDFPASPTNEKIKAIMEVDFKKFIEKLIYKVDKRYNVKYFKYKNNYSYDIVPNKKDVTPTVSFSQAIYDIGANYIFFCTDFFFRNEPILWRDWKNDIKMFVGENSYAMRFVKRQVLPLRQNIKRIKKDFAIDDDTKIISVIFTNIYSNHAPKFIWGDSVFYVINYAEMGYFLKTMVYKKGTPQYEFKFDGYTQLEQTSDKKKKKKAKK